MRTARVALGTLLVIAITLSIQIVYAAQGPEGERTIALIDGQEVDITVGSLIGHGIKGEGLCTLESPIVVGGRVPIGRHGGSSIAWHFDDECRAIVTSIAPLKDDGAGPDGSLQPKVRSQASRRAPGTDQLQTHGLVGEPRTGLEKMLRGLGLIPTVAHAGPGSAHSHNAWVRAVMRYPQKVCKRSGGVPFL